MAKRRGNPNWGKPEPIGPIVPTITEFEQVVKEFKLQPDHEERIIAVPEELDLAMSEDRSLRRWFDRLTYSTRKYLTDQVTAVKSAAARKRRADRIAEQLLSAKEAERDLPPVLESALACDGRAREGWKRMSAGRRRTLLLAIFYYQSPEARVRRVAKVVKEAAGDSGSGG